jgi:hypothetical protein
MTDEKRVTDSVREMGAKAGVIEIYDPPMCCSTGLCGPVQDQSLIDVDQMLREVKSRGVRVERYQMTSNPGVFLKNPEVMRLVREKQLSVLPITVVNGRVLTTGGYPLWEEIEAELMKAGQE